ncbi:hypothetical protein GDO78_009388 [Eleutherodactylus coqui]|uniref:Uncharacterized protein n=1 Tax=Eleutherodactylus coqui TaxID=57060 RepID=A0A8J6K8W3_ELECQ|nr:hypothetical protein GDO78_009388 [Eleutherodactylus coqui]
MQFSLTSASFFSCCLHSNMRLQMDHTHVACGSHHTENTGKSLNKSHTKIRSRVIFFFQTSVLKDKPHVHQSIQINGFFSCANSVCQNQTELTWGKLSV